MPTDRAQDTEAIRAAPPVEGEVPAQWYLDMRLERDRLVARLEAAERALRDIALMGHEPRTDSAYWSGGTCAEVARAALAAAAPGEEAKP